MPTGICFLRNNQVHSSGWTRSHRSVAVGTEGGRCQRFKIFWQVGRLLFLRGARFVLAEAKWTVQQPKSRAWTLPQLSQPVGPGTGCNPGDELRISAFTPELGIGLWWPRACAKGLRPVCAWAWGASGLDATHFPSETSLDHPVEAELSEPLFRSVGMVCLQCASPNATEQASGAHRAGLAASMDPRTAPNTAQQDFLSMLSPLLN